jgi:hypothetical protein
MSEQANEFQAKKERLNAALTILTNGVALFSNIQAAAQSKRDKSVALLAFASLEILHDGVDAAMHHANDGTATGVDDALGLTDRAVVVSAVLHAAFTILTQPVGNSALSELADDLRKFDANVNA